MQLSFTKLLALATALTGSTVYANTPLSNEYVDESLARDNGIDIAMASRPMWHFGRRAGKEPCYPSEALINGQQHGTSPPKWPNSRGECASPGVPAGHPDMSNPFPNYFTVDRCGEDELRVVYSVYYSHDGHSTSVAMPWTGHMHDWERVIVVWRRENNEWTRKSLLLSYHSGYEEIAWDKVQNTFNYDDTTKQGAKNLDGAKIYVGASKHANFDSRNTGWNDPGSQGCKREFRSRDWYYMADSEHMVAAGAGTEAGNAIESQNWGSADGFPSATQRDVCNKKNGGYITC